MRKLLAIAAMFLLVALAGMAGQTASASASGNDNYTKAKRAICYYFGSYCDQALAVVKCETGGSYSVWATNGQYLGMFQMGTYARTRYGHGWNVWIQAKAAWGYFVDSGKDWSPWQCKP